MLVEKKERKFFVDEGHETKEIPPKTMKVFADTNGEMK